MLFRPITSLLFMIVICCSESKPASSCGNEAADIVFVLDSSSSIWIEDYKKQLGFLEDLVSEFDVGPGTSQTRVGAITFSDRPHLEFDLNTHPDLSSLRSAIYNIQHRKGLTRTAEAIEYVTGMFAVNRGGREGVIHLAVVITDGNSRDKDRTRAKSAEAHRSGIQVFAIGVGDEVDETELRAVASEPADEFVLTVSGYGALASITDKLAKRTCEVTMKTEWTTATTVRTPTQPSSATEKAQMDGEIITKSCGGKPADVFFVLDSSSSIWKMDFRKQLTFVQQVVDIFDVSPVKTRIGVATFSSGYQQVFGFEDHPFGEGVKAAVDAVPYLTGGTNMSAAIWRMRTEAFSGKSARRGVAHIGVILTDGKSNDPERTIWEAELAKKAGIYLFTVGIGKGINEEELQKIASNPVENFAFTVENFDVLDRIKLLLAIKTCTVFPTETEKQDEPDCRKGMTTDITFTFDAAFIGAYKASSVYSFISVMTKQLNATSGHLQFGILTTDCFEHSGLVYSPATELYIPNTDMMKHPKTISLLKKYKHEDFFLSAGARPDARQVAVLILEAASITKELELEANLVKSKGTEIFIVGVGKGISFSQVEGLLSEPLKSHFVAVDSYESFTEAIPKFLKMLC